MRALVSALCLGLVAPLLPACRPAAAPELEISQEPDPMRIAYSGIQGIPGPWWRDDAGQRDFDLDQRRCRDESTVARRSAGTGQRKDAAYRAFLDCMTRLAWTRGYPPPRESDAAR